MSFRIECGHSDSKSSVFGTGAAGGRLPLNRDSQFGIPDSCEGTSKSLACAAWFSSTYISTLPVICHVAGGISAKQRPFGRRGDLRVPARGSRGSSRRLPQAFLHLRAHRKFQSLIRRGLYLDIPLET